MPPLDPVLTQHLGALARVAGLYAASSTEREDLLQEILVAAWRALPGFRGESSARTYLLRIAHNRGATWAARRRVFEPEIEAAVEPELDQALDRAARWARLMRAVRALPDGHRQVVSLALEGLSQAEIAEVLGLSENNVAVRLSRARAALRAQLGGQDAG